MKDIISQDGYENNVYLFIMDHIVEIHSDIELNPSNNMQELEDRVKNAMRALQEIMKNKKQMENEKKELEQSLDNLKTDVQIIKKDELMSLITLKNNQFSIRKNNNE